jgi:prepilin-type N-terminal cleavage/methylation domain-containing protein
MTRRNAQLRGFTLLELVLVMMIITITLAIAAPSMRGFVVGRAADSAATELLATLRYARRQAITEGRIYRLMVHEPEPNKYQLLRLAWDPSRMMPVPGQPSVTSTGQGELNFVELGVPIGQPVKMPDNTDLEMIRADRSGVDYIDFYPGGRVDAAEFQIKGPRGEPLRIVCDSPTEGYRLVTAEEASR